MSYYEFSYLEDDKVFSKINIDGSQKLYVFDKGVTEDKHEKNQKKQVC